MIRHGAVEVPVSEWRVNRPERRTQADLLVAISLHLEQRKVVIGVEHDVSRESSCKGSRQAEEE